MPARGLQLKGVSGERMRLIKAIRRRQRIFFFAAAIFLSAVPLVRAASFEEPDGQLAVLRQKLGPNRGISLVVWNPKPIVNNQYFFPLAVRAGIDTVWICGYPFRQMNRQEKQAVLLQASEAGLRTIGFIDGNYDWPKNWEFVDYHYKDLISQLGQLDLGSLGVAFAVNVEPYALPPEERKAGKTWDGNLSSYVEMMEKVVLPPLETFAKNRLRPDGKPVVNGPVLVRFEPWWFENGQVTASGVRVFGLRPIRNTEIASMTYRNVPDDIASVSQIVRNRAKQEGTSFYIGVETIPFAVSKTPSFSGKEEMIGEILRDTLKMFSAAEMERLRGVFIHTKDPDEAYRVLSVLVHTQKNAPRPKSVRPPRIITN